MFGDNSGIIFTSCDAIAKPTRSMLMLVKFRSVVWEVTA